MAIMPEEEKKEKEKVETETTEEVEKTTEEKTDAETTEETKEESKEETEKESKDTGSDTTIDYEAELKKEKEARELAEKALSEDRYHGDKRKEKEEEVEEEEDDDKPLTRAELQAELARHGEEVKKTSRMAQAENYADKISSSDDERNLIIERWKNRGFPESLTLEEQMDEVYASVNSKKMIGERNEVMRALKGKQGVSTSDANVHQDELQQTKSEPDASSADKQALVSAGWVWNSKTKRHEKKSKDGKRTYKRDSKTGAVSPV